MKVKSLIILFAALLVGALSADAQGRKGLVINEVVVDNVTNAVDDYGVHNAWVELYNSNYSPMEIATIYLTTDPANPRMYTVPRGDVNTVIPPRQHVLFWADGEPERGTFHTSFRLTPGQDNWVGIYDSNGITLIDSITIPASLGVDQSYARLKDGVGTGTSAWGIRKGTKAPCDYVSPSSNNVIIDTNIKKAMFAEKDRFGVAMAIMAMGVVFCALILLSLSFAGIGNISKRTAARKKLETTQADHSKEDIRIAARNGESGEEIAAVCMALYEHLNAHDAEDMVLTLKKMQRAYSPWSSKIYSLRETPRR